LPSVSGSPLRLLSSYPGRSPHRPTLSPAPFLPVIVTPAHPFVSIHPTPHRLSPTPQLNLSQPRTPPFNRSPIWYVQIFCTNTTFRPTNRSVGNASQLTLLSNGQRPTMATTGEFTFEPKRPFQPQPPRPRYPSPQGHQQFPVPHHKGLEIIHAGGLDPQTPQGTERSRIGRLVWHHQPERPHERTVPFNQPWQQQRRQRDSNSVLDSHHRVREPHSPIYSLRFGSCNTRPSQQLVPTFNPSPGNKSRDKLPQRLHHLVPGRQNVPSAPTSIISANYNPPSTRPHLQAATTSYHHPQQALTVAISINPRPH